MSSSRRWVWGKAWSRGRRRQSAGLYLILSSSKTPTLPPHFLLLPAALTEPKQTIMRDYYEEEKGKGLASRFLKSLDGSLFCLIQVTDRIRWRPHRFGLRPCLCVLTVGFPHWRHVALCLNVPARDREQSLSGEDCATCWLYYHVYVWLTNGPSLSSHVSSAKALQSIQ